MLWLGFTFFAAFMQAWRNAFQKQLSRDVPVLGVTLARFVFAWPLAIMYLWTFYLRDAALPVPEIGAAFLWPVVGAATAQIVATALMVQLFRLKNYAIGVGLARSEAVLAAVLGVVFFASDLSLLGWLGVLLGGVAVFLMSGAEWRGLSLRVLLLGLASGLGFALTSLWIRQAALALPLPALPAAAWVLCAVIALQAMTLLVWLWWRERGTLQLLFAYPRLVVATSAASFLGSLGWFSAMSLQDVAIVKTVGQIEVLFMLAISAWVFREKLNRQDGLGLALVVLAAILVIWA